MGLSLTRTQEPAPSRHRNVGVVVSVVEIQSVVAVAVVMGVVVKVVLLVIVAVVEVIIVVVVAVVQGPHHAELYLAVYRSLVFPYPVTHRQPAT